MINTNKLSLLLVLLALLFVFSACTEEEDMVLLPPSAESANFAYTLNPDNPNEVTFTAQPDVDTWYTHWDFGDNTAGEGTDATKLYFLAGDYDVRFKIFTDGGTAEMVQTVSIENDIVGPNLIQNGALDGDDFWNVLPISVGVEVAFQDGAATWTGGSFGHVGIYQEIQVEANQEYQINMDMVGSGLTDCWFEVYVGTTVPMAGVDYNDGGIRLGLNTWNGCGRTPFDAQFTAISCVGEGGTFEFPTATTAYLVIRGGGADYGDTGVTVDNISIRPL
jgi:hypothetical protein